jgi:branched-chain amino acid aminotransferase
VRVNEMKSAYLRPVIYRGFGNLGLVPSPNTPIEVAVAAVEWGTYLGEGALERGVDTCVSSWTRLAPNTMPTLAKAGGNYLSSQLIALEAKRHGYAEAIALDTQGYVSEGPGENIFLVRNGVISTPPVTASILDGITRHSIITLARDLGYDVREENILREALYVADEIFFTGTAAEITPVRSVDGLQVGEGRRGPVTAKLQSTFFGLFNGETPDKHHWLTPVAKP